MHHFSLTFRIEARQNVEGVVGEEPAVIQGVAEHLRHRSGGHFFANIVLVHLT